MKIASARISAFELQTLNCENFSVENMTKQGKAIWAWN